MRGLVARRLDLVLVRLDGALERWPVSVWVGFTALLVLRAVAESARKPLWYDELVTYYVTALPSLTAIWQALGSAADGTPPLFHIVERVSTGLFGQTEWAFRLPSVIGCWMMSVAVYLFVRQRASASHAWIAATFPWLTGAAYYITEARSYGLALGCASFALVAWQAGGEAAGRRRTAWLAILAACIAGAISFHYYATLIVMPLVAGEVTRAIRRRRIEPAVWLAFIAGVSPLLIYLPLIRAASGYVTHGSPPALRQVFAFYDRIVVRSIAEEFALAMVAVLIVHLSLLSRRTARAEQAEALAAEAVPPMRRPVPIEERVAIGTFLLIPPCLVLGAHYSHVPYLDRYAIWTVIGLSICLALIARRLFGRRSAVVLAAMFMALSAAHSVNPWARRWPRRSIHPIVMEAPPSGPIVISDVVEFLQTAHYADPKLRSRLHYLADRRAAVRYTGQDESDAHILALRAWTPFHIDAYDTFVAANERFVLCDTSGVFAWMVPRLRDDHADVRMLKKHDDSALYAVTLHHRHGDDASTRASVGASTTDAIRSTSPPR